VSSRFFFTSSPRWDYCISAPPAGIVEARVGKVYPRVTGLLT